jgi:hypothetical protein
VRMVLWIIKYLVRDSERLLLSPAENFWYIPKLIADDALISRKLLRVSEFRLAGLIPKLEHWVVHGLCPYTVISPQSPGPSTSIPEMGR